MVMACIVMAFIVMAYIVMTYIPMTYTGMTYMVMTVVNGARGQAVPCDVCIDIGIGMCV